MATERPLGEYDLELLSAYLDGELSAADRAALEARLQTDARLHRELASLRQTVALIRRLPPVRAPRDFTLTPDMVRSPRILIFPTTPAFSMLSAAAAFLLVFMGALLLTQTDIRPAPLANELVANQQARQDTQIAQAPTLALQPTTVPTVAPSPLSTLGDTLMFAPEAVAQPDTEDDAEAEEQPLFPPDRDTLTQSRVPGRPPDGAGGAAGEGGANLNGGDAALPPAAAPFDAFGDEGMLDMAAPSAAEIASPALQQEAARAAQEADDGVDLDDLAAQAASEPQASAISTAQPTTVVQILPPPTDTPSPVPTATDTPTPLPTATLTPSPSPSPTSVPALIALPEGSAGVLGVVLIVLGAGAALVAVLTFLRRRG